MLDDASIDTREISHDGAKLRVADALTAWKDDAPDLPALKKAAALYVSASPSMVEASARWLLIDARLHAAGLDDAACLHVYARACVRAYDGVHAPDEPVLELAVTRVPGETCLELVDTLVTREKLDPYRDGSLACVALLPLARAGALPERFDRLVSFYRSWPLVRVLLTAMPEARRHARLEELLDEPTNPQNGLWRVQRALPLMDLFSDAQRARLAERVAAVRTSDGIRPPPDLFDRHAAGGGPPANETRGADGLTDDVRNALAYLTEKIAEARMKAALGPLAESRADVAVSLHAPELASVASWCAATDARREEIARDVERAAADFAVRFIGIETFDEMPIAIFVRTPTRIRLSLVPGGEYTRGFSEREEALVRAATEAARGTGNHYEEYQALLDQAGLMRPTARVRVSPFLVFQDPSQPVEPAEVTAMFEEMPFRLLTEAEHEHAARGGAESALTWQGDDVPTEAAMHEASKDHLPNAFGLAALGLYPEALTDVWHPSYEGAPTDGSARAGEGPRVVRGGAIMLSPWQQCGEWHLLTNAVRTNSDHWEFFASIRPALGIKLT